MSATVRPFFFLKWPPPAASEHIVTQSALLPRQHVSCPLVFFLFLLAHFCFSGFCVLPQCLSLDCIIFIVFLPSSSAVRCSLSTFLSSVCLLSSLRPSLPSLPLLDCCYLLAGPGSLSVPLTYPRSVDFHSLLSHYRISSLSRAPFSLVSLLTDSQLLAEHALACNGLRDNVRLLQAIRPPVALWRLHMHRTASHAMVLRRRG